MYIEEVGYNDWNNCFDDCLKLISRFLQQQVLPL